VKFSVVMDSPDNNEDFAGRLLHQGDFRFFPEVGEIICFSIQIKCENNSRVTECVVVKDNDSWRDKA
jgi:hypothetical protein